MTWKSRHITTESEVLAFLASLSPEVAAAAKVVSTRIGYSDESWSVIYPTDYPPSDKQILKILEKLGLARFEQ